MKQHSIIHIANGCSCGCAFCTRSEGHMGQSLKKFDTDSVPECRTMTIMAGDLLDTRIIPVVTAAKNRGTRQIRVYVHPACDNIMPLRDLHRAGVTGIHMMLPASEQTLLTSICGPKASIKNTAMLFKAAKSLDLDVFLEIPVIRENLESLEITVTRALKIAGKLSGVSLPFRAAQNSTRNGHWDYRQAYSRIQATFRIFSYAGIPVTAGGYEGAAPCVMNLKDVTPENYPELDGVICPAKDRPDILSAAGGPCESCFIAPSCFTGMQGFDDRGDRVIPVKKTILNENDSVTATGLFIRKTELDALLDKAAAINRCTAPWDSLEIHDRTGRVSPCEGSWPKREILGTPDSSTCAGWLSDGVVKSFNSPGMTAMRREMVKNGRQATCNSHCPRFSDIPGIGTQDRTPLTRLPRTAVFHENLKKNLEEFIEGAVTLESRPLNITISPSLKCNQHCRMCDLYDETAGKTGVDTPQSVIDEIETLLPTTGTLALTGGEPFTSSRTIRLIESITPGNLPDTRITITTNGSLLSEKNIGRIKNSNLAAVIISLNAADAQTHELITGVPGQFEKIKNNIAAMVNAADTMPLRPAVVLSYVVMRSTLSGLNDFLGLAAALRTQVRLLPVERNRNGESLFTDPETLTGAEAAIRKIRTRYPQPGQVTTQLEHLHRIFRIKLDSGDFSPL